MYLIALSQANSNIVVTLKPVLNEDHCDSGNLHSSFKLLRKRNVRDTRARDTKVTALLAGSDEYRLFQTVTVMI